MNKNTHDSILKLIRRPSVSYDEYAEIKKVLDESLITNTTKGEQENE